MQFLRDSSCAAVKVVRRLIGMEGWVKARMRAPKLVVVESVWLGNRREFQRVVSNCVFSFGTGNVIIKRIV